MFRLPGRDMKKFFLALILSTAPFFLGAENSWKASWITRQYSRSETNSWIAFHKTVDMARVPSTLEARIAADTKYWLWINGEPVVFEGGLKRGPAPGDSYFDKVEIAPFLKEGKNDISILLWHMGKSGFSNFDSGTAAILFEAIGDGIEITSGDDWQARDVAAFSNASTPMTNHRLPETSVRFDARQFNFDWYASLEGRKFGAAMALPVKVGAAPFGKLVERPLPQWKNSGLKDYESVEMKGDTLVCKLPYNAQVTPWISLDAQEGQLIRLETDHTVVTGEQCVRGEYVTCDGEQSYEHLCWMNGEWMYYILPKGFKGTIKDVKYRETGYNTELSGWWHSDDELLDEYWQKAQRTLYVNMRDNYFDCPDRERAQWLGDEANSLTLAFLMLSPSSWNLALKGIYESIGWQKPTGEIFGPIPAGNWARELPMQSLAFVGWYGWREYAWDAADWSFVPTLYDGLHKYLHEVWKTDSAGLPIYRKGGWDWADAGDNCDAAALLAPWYVLALRAEAEFAGRIGRDDDVLEDEKMIARIAESYNNRYWTGSEYRSEGYKGLSDDRVQAMAVHSGIASEEKYPFLLKVLSEQDHATTYMHRYVLDALCLLGHPELAQEKMHRLYPTIMRDNCSTLWEHWNFDGSCNHPWAGCGAIVMGRRFAGITPEEPGYKTFRLAPQMGNLKHIDTGFETSYGFISVVLDRKGNRIDAAVTVPEGTACKYTNRSGKEITLLAGTHKITLKQ